MAKRQSQRGFIPIGFILVALIIVVIAGVGIFVSNHNKKPVDEIGDTTTYTKQPAPVKKYHNFYECFEADNRTYTPGKPNKCTVEGQDFNEPTSFTDDSVRDAAKLPAGVRGLVFSAAAANFTKCSKDNEAEADVPVTQVLSVLGNDWAFVALSCQDSSNEVYMRQPDDTWKMISRSNQKVTCALADQYQIPKELFLTSGNTNDHDTACLKADGSQAQIPYTYKPGEGTTNG